MRHEQRFQTDEEETSSSDDDFIIEYRHSIPNHSVDPIEPDLKVRENSDVDIDIVPENSDVDIVPQNSDVDIEISDANITSHDEIENNDVTIPDISYDGDDGNRSELSDNEVTRVIRKSQRIRILRKSLLMMK